MQASERLDRIERKKNIIIFGMPEDDLEDLYSLETKVLSLFNKFLHLNVHSWEIDFVRRYSHKCGSISKPLAVGLTTMKRKIQIMNHVRKVKTLGMNITEDFPRAVLEKRRTLHKKLERLRREGKYAVLKFDKLFVKEGFARPKKGVPEAKNEV